MICYCIGLDAEGSFLRIRAGLPQTTALGGTSFVTTEPAPTMAPSPMMIPGRMVAFAPMEAPFLTTVFLKASGYILERGKGSFEKVALGPTKTLSSIVMPSQSCTPHLIVQLFPMVTSFSMKTRALILQFSPIEAPERMTVFCQTVVFLPILAVCTSAEGWINMVTICLRRDVWNENIINAEL